METVFNTLRTRFSMWVNDIKNLYPKCSVEVIEILVQNHFDTGNHSLEQFLRINHDCLLGSQPIDATSTQFSTQNRDDQRIILKIRDKVESSDRICELKINLNDFSLKDIVYRCKVSLDLPEPVPMELRVWNRASSCDVIATEEDILPGGEYAIYRKPDTPLSSSPNLSTIVFKSPRKRNVYVIGDDDDEINDDKDISNAVAESKESLNTIKKIKLIDIQVFESSNPDNVCSLTTSEVTSIDTLKHKCLDVLDLFMVSQCDLYLKRSTPLVVASSSSQCSSQCVDMSEDQEDAFTLVQDNEIILNRNDVCKVVVKENIQFENVKVEAMGDVCDSLKLLSGSRTKQSTVNPSLNEFCKYFPISRQVRGDGNCFYRSLIFSILEVLLNESNAVEKVEAFLKNYSSNRHINESAMEDIANLLTALAFTEETRGTNRCDILRDQVNSNEALDRDLVIFCRSIIADYIEKKVEVEESSQVETSASSTITLSQIVSANFDMTILEFVDNVVLAFGRDAEDIILFESSFALDVPVNIWLLDEKLSPCIQLMTDPNLHEKITQSLFSRTPDINLLLRGGHYNIIYKKNTHKVGASSLVHHNTRFNTSCAYLVVR